MKKKKFKKLRAKSPDVLERLLYQHTPDGYKASGEVKKRRSMFRGQFYEMIIEKTI